MGRERAAIGVVAGIAFLILVGLAWASVAVARQSRTLNDGVYTSVQAQRGAKLWERVCADCHQSDEFVRYLHGYVGRPVSVLYEAIRTQMPENNPGALSRKQYADVLTYVFEMNGLPTGEDEMAADPKTLESIVIDVPPAGP